MKRLANAACVVGLVLLLLLLAALYSRALVPPASGADPYWPTLYAPVGDGGPVVVQIDAPPGTWEVRRSARLIDAQVDGLTIRTTGDCATADACVRVVVDSFDAAEMAALSGGHWAAWTGLTTYGPERFIYLNTDRATTARFRRHVAAHELGHAIGLAHHQSTGLMSDVPQRALDTLHPREAALLATYYGVTG